MSTDENKALVRAFIEDVVNRGATERLEEFVAADFALHVPGLSLPTGPEGYRRVFGMLLGAFPDFHVEIHDILADGDKVMLRVTESGTHQGKFMGVAPTGKVVSWLAMGIMRVAGGKIAEEWGLPDAAGQMQQLGVLPSPTPAIR